MQMSTQPIFGRNRMKTIANSVYGMDSPDSVRSVAQGGHLDAQDKYNYVRDLELDIYSSSEGKKQAVLGELSKRIAQRLAEILTKDENVLFDFVLKDQVSYANPTALMEAILALGLPNDYKLVFGSSSIDKRVFEMYMTGLHGSPGVYITDEDDRVAIRITDREMLDCLMLTDRKVTADANAFVDFTFRLPLTDELKAYLPEIKSRYETVKRMRDCMYTGKNPLDEE